MKKKLWLKVTDIPELTSFSGNIEPASLLPHIYTAQRTEIKRVLGIDLYNYFDTKIQAGEAFGEQHQIIFNEYVIDMLVYFSAMNYMAFGGYKTANAGVYKQTIDNAQVVDYKEVAVLIDRYRQLAVSVEKDYNCHIQNVNLTEIKDKTPDSESNVFGWF